MTEMTFAEATTIVATLTDMAMHGAGVIAPDCSDEEFTAEEAREAHLELTAAVVANPLTAALTLSAFSICLASAIMRLADETEGGALNYHDVLGALVAAAGIAEEEVGQ